MTLYLDTSALVKTVAVERETRTLESWLGRRRRLERITSALTRTELARAVIHRDAATRARASERLRAMTLVGIDDAILDVAGQLQPSGLRSLDAIHLASALRLGPRLETLVSYDRRMLDAAAYLGIDTAHPGVRW